jgi:hypothetical protein
MRAVTIAFVAAILAASLAAPQQPPERLLASFLITIETTPTEVMLTCEKGCEWEILRFPLDIRDTLVDDRGVVSDEVGEQRAGDGFLLAIHDNEGAPGHEGLHVGCNRGCAWQGYGFGPRRVPWVIDQCEIVPKMLWKASTLPCAERQAERERGRI